MFRTRIIVVAYICTLTIACSAFAYAAAPAPEADTDAALANAELYKAAVIDAMTIEDDEILPLVEISKNS